MIGMRLIEKYHSITKKGVSAIEETKVTEDEKEK